MAVNTVCAAVLNLRVVRQFLRHCRYLCLLQTLAVLSE